MKKTDSTPNKIKAKVGFHGVSDTDTVKALMTAYEGLLNNLAYPNHTSQSGRFQDRNRTGGLWLAV